MLEPPRGFAKGISGGHDKMGKEGRRSRDEHGPEITDKGELQEDGKEAEVEQWIGGPEEAQDVWEQA